MPLAGPAIAAVAIFSCIGAYSNFLWPLIIVTSTEMMPLTVGLADVTGAYAAQNAQNMAASILAVFLICQRPIVQGIAGIVVDG
jgi:multiple sugar transport system permease protein